jgi:stearoyl-CoA desaturase (delta-9 desaturase)
MEAGTPLLVRRELKLNWTNTLFIGVSHLVGIVAIWYMAAVQFSWWSVGLGILWLGCSSMSITGGYHRLFAHSAYKAAWPLRLFYLMFGAAGIQNSAIKWAIDHRIHHTKVDTDKDPYNIKRGFWWAHIVWIFYLDPEGNSVDKAKDLVADRLVMFQHKFYVWIAIVMNVVIPAALGMIWGDPVGAVLIAGFLRLVLQWHATFSINSFTHLIGSQPFSTENSARDSFVAALITMGEGYHNYHHRFQTDYRNGIRWYQFDPTKWFVWSLSTIGVTSDLRRTAKDRVAQARASVIAQREAALSSFSERSHAAAQALAECGAQAKQAIAETTRNAQAMAHDVMEKGEQALAAKSQPTPD